MADLEPLDVSLYYNRLDLPNAEAPLETIYELTPYTDMPWSIAIADINQSDEHYHNRTTEVYTCLEGKLEIHLDASIHFMVPGSSITIEPGIHHWARSLNPTAARVLVVTIPPWDPADHIMG